MFVFSHIINNKNTKMHRSFIVQHCSYTLIGTVHSQFTPVRRASSSIFFFVLSDHEQCNDGIIPILGQKKALVWGSKRSLRALGPARTGSSDRFMFFLIFLQTVNSPF